MKHIRNVFRWGIVGLVFGLIFWAYFLCTQGNLTRVLGEDGVTVSNHLYDPLLTCFYLGMFGMFMQIGKYERTFSFKAFMSDGIAFFCAFPWLFMVMITFVVGVYSFIFLPIFFIGSLLIGTVILSLGWFLIRVVFVAMIKVLIYARIHK